MKKMNKYWQWIKMGLKSQISYKGIISDRLLGFLVQFILMYFFWKAVYRDNIAINGRTFSEMFIYLTFSTSILAAFLYPSISFMSSDIRSGKIVTLLLKPMDYQMQYLCKQCGIFLFMSTLLCPILLAVCLSQKFIPGIGRLCLFIVSLLLGFLFITVFDFLLGTLCFWTENGWGIISLKTVLFDILSGGMIPLDLLPDWARMIVIQYMPFSKVVYAPVMILQGKYRMEEILYQYGILLVWILLCFGAGRMILHWAYKGIISNGG
ncbi:MAG: ABC transporter permease [Lachnospiraceae bacterium]